MIDKCPNCGGELIVTSYKCKKCATELKGNFEQDVFQNLSADEKEFVILFLKKRGSIKEVGSVIGMSYPTVRNRIDKIVKKLGQKPENTNESRVEILNMLDNGEITATQAEELLKEI